MQILYLLIVASWTFATQAPSQGIIIYRRANIHGTTEINGTTHKTDSKKILKNYERYKHEKVETSGSEKIHVHTMKENNERSSNIKGNDMKNVTWYRITVYNLDKNAVEKAVHSTQESYIETMLDIKNNDVDKYGSVNIKNSEVLRRVKREEDSQIGINVSLSVLDEMSPATKAELLKSDIPVHLVKHATKASKTHKNVALYRRGNAVNSSKSDHLKNSTSLNQISKNEDSAIYSYQLNGSETRNSKIKSSLPRNRNLEIWTREKVEARQTDMDITAQLPGARQHKKQLIRKETGNGKDAHYGGVSRNHAFKVQEEKIDTSKAGMPSGHLIYIMDQILSPKDKSWINEKEILEIDTWRAATNKNHENPLETWISEEEAITFDPRNSATPNLHDAGRGVLPKNRRLEIWTSEKEFLKTSPNERDRLKRNAVYGKNMGV